MGAPYIAVVGAGRATEAQCARARAVGEALARAGAVLVCGGLGGVMAAACAGARSQGGVTVGLLPGGDRSEANEHVTIALATGLGELRNGLVVRCADAVVAVGGEMGTLSEIAFALKTGRPVVSLDSWDVSAEVQHASDPEDAVRRAISAAKRMSVRSG
jgi:uncharacterized protein (TIGR00725 family)